MENKPGEIFLFSFSYSVIIILIYYFYFFISFIYFYLFIFFFEGHDTGAENKQEKKELEKRQRNASPF